MTPQEQSIRAIVNQESWKDIEAYFRERIKELLDLGGIDTNLPAETVAIEVKSRQLASETLNTLFQIVNQYVGTSPEEKKLGRVIK